MYMIIDFERGNLVQRFFRSKSVNVYKRRDGRPKNAYYRSNLNIHSDLEGVPLVPPYHK